MSQYRYEKLVFVTPPWKEIYTTDTERYQTYEHSVGVYELIVDWNQQYDYLIKEIPFGSVADRADYVRGEMGLAQEEADTKSRQKG